MGSDSLEKDKETITCSVRVGSRQFYMVICLVCLFCFWTGITTSAWIDRSIGGSNGQVNLLRASSSGPAWDSEDLERDSEERSDDSDDQDDGNSGSSSIFNVAGRTNDSNDAEPSEDDNSQDENESNDENSSQDESEDGVDLCDQPASQDSDEGEAEEGCDEDQFDRLNPAVLEAWKDKDLAIDDMSNKEPLTDEQRTIWDPLMTEDPKPTDGTCAENEGIIVLNSIGGMGWNLFQLAFARRLAAELCTWKIMYRTIDFDETSLFHEERTLDQCLPNAVPELVIPRDHVELAVFNDEAGVQEGPWSDEVWEALASHLENVEEVESSGERYHNWLDEMGSEKVHEILFKEADGPEELVSVEQDMQEVPFQNLVTRLKGESSTTKIVNLEHFFMDYGWMKGDWQKYIHDWFRIDAEKCCFTMPKDDTVILYVGEYSLDRYEVSVYASILEHYDFSERELWIVTQRNTILKSHMVRDLVINLGEERSLSLYTGRDMIDMLCILSQAKTIITTPGSEYTEMAAFLGRSIVTDPEVTIHYPTKKIEYPDKTLKVTDVSGKWLYHLVNGDEDGIEKFEVPVDTVQVIPS